jgi:hypothetical protein
MRAIVLRRPATCPVERDNDVLAFEPDGVSPHAKAVVDEGTAGRNVELPLVPGAA